MGSISQAARRIEDVLKQKLLGIAVQGARRKISNYRLDDWKDGNHSQKRLEGRRERTFAGLGLIGVGGVVRPPEAFPAAGQMGSHSRPRPFGIAPENRFENTLMFAIDETEILHLDLGVLDHVDTGAWNRIRALVAHDIGKVAISGGIGDL
jgi:hypothetical protein